MMSSLKPHLGKQSKTFRDEITASRISAFCQSIGIPESPVAPPTFMTVFRRGEFELFQELGIELARILHAEQEYQYENPIRAGETLVFQTVMKQVLEKHTSTHLMQFATFETSFQTDSDSGQRPVGKAKTTIVIRHSLQ